MTDARNISHAIRRELSLQRLAGWQKGLATTGQLHAIGFTDRAIDWRTKTERLVRTYRGVYAVGRRELSRDGHFLAAVLSVGAGAVLSHFAAAALWGFWNGSTIPIDVTVTRKVRPRKGIRVHHVAELAEHSLTTHHGIPVTTPSKTVLDLAGMMYSQRHFRRVVHEAEAQQLVDPELLRVEIAQARPRTPGRQRLLDEIADGPKPTRSGLEDDILDLLRRHHFPPFETNARVPGTPPWVNVDFIFELQKVVIETDGGPWHRTKFRRELDAHKQNLLETAGFGVLRLDEDDATPQAEARTVAEIWRALGELPI